MSEINDPSAWVEKAEEDFVLALHCGVRNRWLQVRAFTRRFLGL